MLCNISVLGEWLVGAAWFVHLVAVDSRMEFGEKPGGRCYDALKRGGKALLPRQQDVR